MASGGLWPERGPSCHCSEIVGSTHRRLLQGTWKALQPETLLSEVPLAPFLQVAENQQLFRALKALLEDFRSELREDEHARLRLQQQYASDKAAWDVEWAVLKCRLEQVPAPWATSLLNTVPLFPLQQPLWTGLGQGEERGS